MLRYITDALRKKVPGYKNNSHEAAFVYRDDSVAVRYDDINKATNDIVAEAQDYVLIQAYKFVKGKKSADELLAALKELNKKAELNGKKIKIYFLLNKRVGPAAIATGKYNDPRYEHQLKVFEDLAKECPNLEVNYTYHKHSGFDSYHTKYIVVDGKKAMVRGCDFGDSERFETNLTVDGPVVQHVIDDFCDGWNANSDKKINANSLYAEIDKNADVNDRIILLCKKEKKLASSKQNPFKIAILTAIQHAAHSINIMTPNVNDKEILDALIKAAKKGIAVKIYLGKFHNEKQEKWYGGTNLKWMEYLKNESYSCATPIEVRWATHDDKLVQDNTPQAMHGKVIIIDNAYVITGSSALDKQALCNSREADVFVQSSALAARYNTIFTNEFTNGFRYHSVRDSINELIIDEIKRLTYGVNPLKTSSQYKVEAYQKLQEMLVHPSYKSDSVNIIVDKWLALTIKDRPIEKIMKEQRSIFKFWQTEHSKSEIFIKNVRDKFGDSLLNNEVKVKNDKITRLKGDEVKIYNMARYG